MSIKRLRRVQGTLFALSLVALGAGCSTSHPRYYATERSSSFANSGGTQNYQTYNTQSGTSGSTATTDASGNTVIPLYQESVRVGTREVDAGAVRLRKVVTTETVNQPVQIRKETVVIDREPAGNQPSQTTANYQQNGGPAFQEQETVIHLKREEPVVETQVVPTGRIVVQRKSEPQQQNIQRQVRHEEIQVEKIGNPENVIISENLRNSTRQSESTGAGGATTGQTQGTATSNSNSGTP